MNAQEKVFLHVDMDAFFASVEQQDHPEWRGKPVVVGSPPDQRGVVSAASYEARTFGIHSAMPSSTAYRKCPDAVFLPVNMPRYREVSKQIMRIFESFTPLIQPLSIDEAFLDVSGVRHLFGNGETIARKIKATIKEQTGLTTSAGVAPNMFLAKLASDMNKPDGLTLVPFDQNQIERFLAPLPIDRIWGVGKVTRNILLENGIPTIGKLQQSSLGKLEKIFGTRTAEAFFRLARGIDHREIGSPEAEKSISNETTFNQDETDPRIIEAVFLELTDKVGSRLRHAGLFAGTVHLKLRWGDFSTITRQIKLAAPICDDITLRTEGLALLHKHLQNQPVRLIGFGVSNLTDMSQSIDGQLDLFQPQDKCLREKRSRLSRTTDRIRDRFGEKSIQRGSAIKKGKQEDPPK